MSTTPSSRPKNRLHRALERTLEKVSKIPFEQLQKIGSAVVTGLQIIRLLQPYYQEAEPPIIPPTEDKVCEIIDYTKKY